jgi:hypothetical protein
MRYTFPTGYAEAQCVLVPIPVVIVPIVAGLLRQLEAREAWNTEQDYEQGYNAIVELEALMINNCLEELVESNRQIYRLIDNIFNNKQYAVQSLEPLAIFPAIPTVPEEREDVMGIVERTRDVRNLLDNALNGTRYAAYNSGTSMRVDLATIRQMLEEAAAAENQDEILGALSQIALLLA